jgi:hypothetical protein
VRRTKLNDLSVDQLIGQFIEIGIAQDKALMMDELANFKKFFTQMEVVKAELKSRDGDQRRALLRLYNHPNMQVRLKAVKATLAVAPTEARRMLEAIANSHHFPQAGEAGMSLDNLDQGIFKPT